MNVEQRAAVSRRNGKRGGRPVGNTRVYQLMREHGYSRQWAYRLIARETRNRVKSIQP